MASKKKTTSKKRVKVADLPKPEAELTPEQAKAVKGGFNPQPEPPKTSRRRVTNPATLKGFNPQPEPPGTPGG